MLVVTCLLVIQPIVELFWLLLMLILKLHLSLVSNLSFFTEEIWFHTQNNYSYVFFLVDDAAPFEVGVLMARANTIASSTFDLTYRLLPCI